MDEDDDKIGTKNRSVSVRQASNTDRTRSVVQERMPSSQRGGRAPKHRDAKTTEVVDTTSWLTHADAADVCRVSHNTIRNWVKQGWLHPQKAMREQSNGAHREITVFDPVALAKMARRRGTALPNDPGELTARAFELFEEGKTLREVVIIVRAELQRVEELRDQWLNCGGSELVITPVARQELERLVGSFDGVADLVQRVSALTKATRPSAVVNDAVVPS